MEAEHEDAPAKVNENAHARKRPVPPTTLDDDEGLARAIELSQRKVDDDLDAALAYTLSLEPINLVKPRIRILRETPTILAIMHRMQSCFHTACRTRRHKNIFSNVIP